MNYLDVKCPACGAKLDLRPGQKDTKCDYCDSFFVVKAGELCEASETEKSEFINRKTEEKKKNEYKENDTDKAVREAQEEIDRNKKRLPPVMYPGRALMSYFIPSLIVMRLINNYIAKDLGPVKLTFGILFALLVFVLVDVSCVLYEKYLRIMIKGADERIRKLHGETISREENRELERVVMAGLTGNYSAVGAAALKGSKSINPLMILLAGPWLLFYPVMATHTLRVKNPYKKKTAKWMLIVIWIVFGIMYATIISSGIKRINQSNVTKSQEACNYMYTTNEHTL